MRLRTFFDVWGHTTAEVQSPEDHILINFLICISGFYSALLNVRKFSLKFESFFIGVWSLFHYKPFLLRRRIIKRGPVSQW